MVTRTPTTVLSVREAAHVLRARAQNIQRAIDRHRLPARVRQFGGRPMRGITLDALLEFAVERNASRYVLFTPSSRRVVKDALMAVSLEDLVATAVRPGKWRQPPLPPVPPVDVGPVRLEIREAVQSVLQGVVDVMQSRDMVVRDPQIRGGEPIVRGTRVPAYRLQDLHEQGVPKDILLEEYPSLTPESLEAALLYTTLHPRSGRPPRPAPWRKGRGKVLLGAKEAPQRAKKATREATSSTRGVE